MAVIAELVIEGVNPQQYDDVRAKIGWLATPPQGGIGHLTWWDGDTCHNVDAWESEDALNQFADTHLGPAMAAVGVTSAPRVTLHAAYEIFVPEAVKITVT
ncbi:MAG TPA: hypothetical protein VF230_10245 [Acidimicrobiales bacterium]